MKRKEVLSWCGVVYILFGLASFGLLLLPDLRPKNWPTFVVIGVLGVWFIAAGYSLTKLSKVTYFLALPLALIGLVGVPIGTILSGAIGYCLFKEAPSVFGHRASPERGVPARAED